MNMRFTIQKDSRGLTLLETLVWIGMFTMIMGAIVSTMVYFYRANSYTLQGAIAITSAQHGVDTMIRTIRQAAYASNGAYPIVSLGANDLVLYANIDTDPAIERVHYYVLGASLYQGVLDPSGDPPVYSGTETVTVLADNVQNLTQGVNAFTYFDANGLQMADLTKISDVRVVTVNLSVDTDTSRLPGPVTIRSSAAMRNIVGH